MSDFLTGGPCGTASLAERVYAARVELAYELSPRSLAASVAVSILCAVFFSSGNPPLAVPAWWLALTALTVLRYWTVHRFRAARPGPSEARTWARRAVLGAFAAGVLWGTFLLALAPAWGDAGYPLAVFMVAGIPAVSLGTNKALFPLYAAFLFPVLLPYAVKLAYFAGGDTFQVLGSIAALIYCAALVAIARVASRSIAEALELRLRNLDLVADVTRANDRLRSEIARREAVEQALVTAKEAAESANAAKSRFLAKMSHEIRTPMNGIIGMTELLKESGLSSGQKRYAEHVDEAAHSLLQVVNDILDVSRVEAGRLRLERRDFDLRSAVIGAVRLLETKAREKGLGLHWSLADRVPASVKGDPGRLRQVLVNLVGNAVKFTSAGTVRVSVVCADPQPADGWPLRFEILDTGVGIPEDAQAHLFEPFVLVDESMSRRFGGTGLGLAICRQLVGMMGGEIGLESRPGEGARFWFTARFGRADAIVPKFEERPATAPRALRGRVLLVEDNPINREVALAALASLGCSVEVAEDGAVAVSRAARERYDVILMDCEMPGMDGYEAARAIRVRERTSATGKNGRVPIVALTASALAPDRERALRAGMDEHLSKPFTREDLGRGLARWLEPVASAPSSEAPERGAS